MYVLINKDNRGQKTRFVSGRRGESYTGNIRYAKRYYSVEEAKNDSCPENEFPVRFDSLFRY